MGDNNDVKIAVIEQRLDTVEKKVDKSDANQRWVVIAILGGVLATVMERLGITGVGP